MFPNNGSTLTNPDIPILNPGIYFEILLPVPYWKAKSNIEIEIRDSRFEIGQQ